MDLSTLMPQQLQIVKTLDRPLFVSAGAGSGKTFTLKIGRASCRERV